MQSLHHHAATILGRILVTDGKHVLNGGFWLMLGQAIAVASGIITTALLAHYLPENDYGTYRYLISLSVIFTGLSLTGIGQTLLQAGAKKIYDFYYTSLHVSAFYSLGTAVAALVGGLYYLINQNITLAIGCIIIALLQPFFNVYLNIFSFTQGSGKYRASTTAFIIKTLFVATVSILTLLLTKNVLVLLTTYLLSHSIANYITHVYHKPIKRSGSDISLIQQYIKYAQHTSIQNLILNTSSRIDSIIIFTQLGASDLAVYSVANLLPEQIKVSFKNITNLMFPSFVRYNNWQKLQRTVFTRSIQLFTILTVITLIYLLIAPTIYLFLFPKYETAVRYSQLLALTFPLFAVLVPYNALQAQLEDRVLYLVSIVTSIVNILSLLILIPMYGLMGAILARFVYRLVYTLVSFGFIVKIRYEHR